MAENEDASRSKRKTQASAAQEHLRKAWDVVCSNEDGRAVLYDILCRAGINDMIFHSNAMTMAGLAFRQAFAHELRNQIDPDIYILMQAEARRKEVTNG